MIFFVECVSEKNTHTKRLALVYYSVSKCVCSAEPLYNGTDHWMGVKCATIFFPLERNCILKSILFSKEGENPNEYFQLLGKEFTDIG